ncbi:hypothetical protein GGS26DRAFT_596121 [Hypomontagnella submonticulosa]|nr:hypothetical protein GGS26DRAFT_596121 [Hypomontagnella submonticulosa]
MPTALTYSKTVGDGFSRIAIASGLSGKANSALVTGDGNRDPSWLWPPPLYQPYCNLHFLKECSVYHLRENEAFKAMMETIASKSKKSSKWPAAPTRVQPARRAREKNWKGQSEISTSRQNSPSRQDRMDGPSTALETLYKRLQLHLSWPIYKNQLESRITQIADELVRRYHQGSTHESLLSSPLISMPCLECRYCRFNPEAFDREGSISRRLAPPAPMHFIRPDDMKGGQVGEYGGVKFAIDVSNGHKTIVLLGMEKLGVGDYMSLGKSSAASPERGGSVERSASTKKTPRSRKKARI